MISGDAAYCTAALHIARGETTSAISAAVIFVLVSVVAYGRWKVQPLRARKRT